MMKWGNNDADILPVVASSVSYATGYSDGQSINFPAVSGNYVNIPMTISGSQLSIAFWANANVNTGIRGFFNYNYNNGIEEELMEEWLKLLY